MKQLLKKSVFSLVLLLSSITALGQANFCSRDNCLPQSCITPLNANSQVHTYINYRSQGANTARELVGWQTEIYRPDMCDCYGVTTFAFEYTRSFRDDRIAQDWFGTTCLRFQGSGVAPRTDDALVAEYFGLAPDFSGAICFSPLIDNFIFDWNLFLGLDCWHPGLYFRLHLPIVHSRWTLFNEGNGCFNCPTPVNTTTLPACLLGTTEGATAAVTTIQDAFACGNPIEGQIFGANRSGCFTCCRMDDTKVADIDFILGWLPYNTDCYHFGIFLQYVAPTGTDYSRDKNRSFGGTYFRPQIGNGHHHELGAGITGHTMLWDNQQNKSLAFYFEGNVTHMFGDRQCRLFDLCNNGAYSRYMLLREFNSDGTPTGNLIRANNTAVANKVVDVKIDAKVDFSFKFAYRYCNWAFDLGYNVYYHSAETLDKSCPNISCPADNFRYGIAGLTGVCCFNYPLIGGGTPGCIVDTDAETTAPVSATAPLANMFTPETGMIPLADAITTGDSVCLAWNSTSPESLGVLPTCAELTAANGIRPIQGDLATPVFLEGNVINLNSGLSPEILTHKIFGHINYMWCDKCGWNPFFGIGFEVEFDGNDRNDNCFTNCTTNSNNCIGRQHNQRVGLNQWGVWIKGGFNF